MTQNNNTQDKTIAQTVEAESSDHCIQTADEFGNLLFAWHNKQVATVKHFLDVPPGTEVQVGDLGHITLENDILKGYKLGIELALYYLGSLPFSYVQGENEAQVVDPVNVEESVPVSSANSSVH